MLSCQEAGPLPQDLGRATAIAKTIVKGSERGKKGRVIQRYGRGEVGFVCRARVSRRRFSIFRLIAPDGSRQGQVEPPKHHS